MGEDLHTGFERKWNHKIHTPILMTPASVCDDHVNRERVLLLGSYSPFESLGWWINNPTEFSVHDILESEQIDLATFRDIFVWNGGPQNTWSASVLQVSERFLEYETKIGNRLGVSNLEHSLFRALYESSCLGRSNLYKIVVGSIIWGAKELDQEISQKKWILFEYDEEIAFSTPPLMMRSVLLERGKQLTLSLPFELTLVSNKQR